MNAAPQSVRKIAYTAVAKALKSGEVVKPDQCSKCNKRPPEVTIYAHHSDYSKPLEIEWLCGSCHKITHIKLGDVTRLGQVAVSRRTIQAEANAKKLNGKRKGKK